MKKPETIRNYIKSEPAEVQKYLKRMYAIVRKAAPKAATEKLAWSMPTLCLEGNLLHFCAFNHHLSLFPGTDAIKHFEKDLKKFQTSKGTIQFPYEEALPVALITRIVKFCVKRNLANAKAKKLKSKRK